MQQKHRHGDAGRFLSSTRKLTEDPEKFMPGLLKKRDIAAELGCGPGYYSKTIVQHVAKLYCVDKDGKALDIARKRVGPDKALFLNENSSKTSIRPRSVDVVILANSFHDMDRKTAASEVKRILCERGRIIVVDWKKKRMNHGPPLELRMDEVDYLSFFSGFVVNRRFRVGSLQYGIVLERAR